MELDRIAKLATEMIADINSDEALTLYKHLESGKMLRSKLVLSVVDSDEAYRLCAIIELIQSASLLHDDVIDSSDLRRGKPSLNARFGNKNAIMLGDILYSRAFFELSHFPKSIAQSLSKSVVELSVGELEDVNLEQSFNEYEEKYLSMIGHKSASLIAASAECAALLKSEVELLDSKNMESSGENARGLEFATNCHIERSEISSMESKKDFSPMAQNDKKLDSSGNMDKDPAEVSLSDFSKETSFCGSQGGGEGSYLKVSERADTADVVAKQHSCEALVQTCKIHTCKSVKSIKTRQSCSCFSKKTTQILDSNKDIHKLYYDYGFNLGMAFQIIDDILDITQDSTKLGKPALSDFKSGKTTLPYIYLYHALPKEKQVWLKSLFKQDLNAKDAQELKDLLLDSPLQKAREKALEYGNKALHIASMLNNQKLYAIIQAMIERDF